MKRFLLPALCSLAATSCCSAAELYHLTKTIPIGGDGGWDYAAVDTGARRLYVSHATQVVVIDLETDKVVGKISDLAGVHGIAFAPELNRAFVSCGKDNTIAVVDAKTLATLSKIKVGENPDAILFEPKHAEVYTFNGRSNDATVVAAKSGETVTTIKLGGKPEFAVQDGKAGRIFVNLEDKNEIVAIDSAKHAVVARWPLAPGEEPTGLAIDLKKHRLFAVCGSKHLVMLDYTTGKVVATLAIGEGADACVLDQNNQFVFASCGDGTTTIARVKGDMLEGFQILKTAKGCRTMTMDPATGKLFMAAAELEPATAGAARPTPVAGSFKVLVFGPHLP